MRVYQLMLVLLMCCLCAGLGWMAGRSHEPPRRRYRHLKRGSTYQVVSELAKVQASRPIVEGDHIVVYRAEMDGTDWARPVGEFCDGRFEELRP